MLAASGLEGLFCCALRPHLIWGPRDRHLIPRLLAPGPSGPAPPRRRRHEPDRHGLRRERGRRPPQAADALTPGSPVAGRAYFISQGEPVNCWQWIDEILALAGLPPVEGRSRSARRGGSGPRAKCVYGVLRRKDDPPMTRFLAAQLARSHYFDIGRARATSATAARFHRRRHAPAGRVDRPPIEPRSLR